MARSLQRRGAAVTVVERGRLGAATSAGNAGWVTPGLSAPIPAPGVVAQALRWMLDPESPFLIRPRIDPAFLAWGARFVRAARGRTYRAGLKATLALAEPTPALFDALAAEGVRFEMHCDGLLFLVRDEHELEHWLQAYEELGALGFDGRVRTLDRRAVRELEPAIADSVVAGLHAGAERHVRPETLCAGLAAKLQEDGARLEQEAAVTGVERRGDSWQVRTADGAIDADAVVIAAGVWTRELLASLGVRMRLEAAKGYSVTADAGDSAPRLPLYLTEAKIGVSPFDGGVRIAGTLELAGIDLSVNRRRVDALVAHASGYLRSWRPEGARVDWAGLRPVAPDGLPYIGAVPGHPGLFAATGHAMLGVTLAPATGEALAPLVLGEDEPEVLRAFALDRR